ncbi:Neutral protease 2 like protein [Verticillium longisporum]|uniref:Neutral protease 2 like protein n=1 Tax=Verticillium longisporum TaxID=100787 RepID=A0A8I2ZEI4_VERLO|nr:Neutral protease 2 like protein [Verticillium longisporum]
MKVLVAISSLALLAGAASVDLSARATPLVVRLEESGNSGIKGYLTNAGNKAVKLLTLGTFLDDRPVEKVEVFSGEDAFRVINAGETVEVDFDAGELHDLSPGGTFDVQTKGAFSTATLNSTVISGALPYSSNVLSTVVNGSEAAAVHHTFQSKAKRTDLAGDCTGTRRAVTTTAIKNCAKLATAAKTAAQNTNRSSKSRLQKYFKSSSAKVSKQVSTVFGRIEKECCSTTSGVSSYHCTDIYNACRTGVIAYTLPSQSFMVNCRIFFDQMPPTDKRCHSQDQQTTILHEMTHLTEIAGTEDYGGYGFDFVRSLTPAQNLNHADTYTLFAQSIFARC